MARPRRKMFPADFVERVMEMGSAPFSPSCMLGSYPSLSHSCPLTVASDPDVCCAMAGCLGLVVLVRVTLGGLLLVM